jgi:hypothetical protein
MEPAADDLNDHPTADDNPVRYAVKPNSSPTADIVTLSYALNKLNEQSNAVWGFPVN